MTLEQLFSLCSRFQQMGDSVADQACAVVVDGEPLIDQNANALRRVGDFLIHVEREAQRSGDDDLASEAGELFATIDAHVAKRLAQGTIVSGRD